MSAQRRVREASDEAPLMTSNIAWGGEEEEIVPPPHSKLAYGILLLQGFGLLIPWNVILNTIPYFQDLNPEHKDGIAFFLTAAYVFPQLPMMLGTLRFANRVPLTVRIVSMLAIQAVVMAFMPLIAEANMWFMLSAIFVIGLTTAVLQSAVFGLTSMFPPIFSQGMMAGQGLAGITASVTEMIFMGTIKSDKPSAIAYYIFTALCLVACIVSYFYFVRMPFAKYYIAAAKRPHKPVEDYSPTDDTALSMNSDPEDEKASLAGGHHHVSMWSVAKQIWPMGMSVWGVFMITFMIFPGVVPSGIPYRQTVKSWNIDNAWWVTFCFLIFNIFDTSGRTLAGYVGRLGGFKLLIAVFVRVAFIPMFYGDAHSQHWMVWMNDFVFIIFYAVFSITNGYFASLAMMKGPALVRPHERETAGLLMSVFLQGGILMGTITSFAFTGGPST